MSQITYRGNLAAASWPLLARNHARSVIVAGPDQNFNRQTVSTEDRDKDIGIPQAYYLENVMPFEQGFQSIALQQEVPNIIGDTFTQTRKLYPVRDDIGNFTYITVATSGHVWYLDLVGGGWVDAGVVDAGITQFTRITVAFVGGITYIYFSAIGCWTFDFTAHTFTVQVLSGLSTTDVLGLTTAAGYLIAYTINSIAWSSTVTPTDFIPSLITGAGGGEVEGLLGTIVTIITHTLGFIIYATDNIIPVIYSGNARYPFNFRAIANSSGLDNYWWVTVDADTPSHYAFTKAGLQKVSTQQTTSAFPEVTDFFGSRVVEEFNSTTLLFSYTSTSDETIPLRNFATIADRYLVISYGKTDTAANYAIIYDSALKRWGKVKIDHILCFEYIADGQKDPARKSIGFLAADGTISTVRFDFGSASSVLLLGKFQYVRERFLQLDQIDFELSESGDMSVFDLPALDGKTLQPYVIATQILNTSEGLGSWKIRCTGLNHTIVAKGKFQLNSMVLKFNPTSVR